MSRSTNEKEYMDRKGKDGKRNATPNSCFAQIPVTQIEYVHHRVIDWVNKCP